MQFSIRSNARVAVGTVVMAMAFGLPARDVAAQDQGSWGVEGRLNGGAFLTAWLSPQWTALFGGTFSRTTNDTDGPSGSKISGSSLTLNATLRKEIGTGRVRPFLGIGPTIQYQKSSRSQTAPAISSSNSVTSFGGRAEAGGLVRVMEHVDVGIVGGLNVSRGTGKNEDSTNNNLNQDVTQTTISAGGLQFLIRVRF